jgi:hypothetical protein
MFLLSLIALLSDPALAVDGYKAAKWGMTVDQVSKLVPALKDCGESPQTQAANTSVLCGEIVFFGKKGQSRYGFEKGKLSEVALTFSDSESVSDPVFVSSIGEMLVQKYGKPTYSDHSVAPTGTKIFTDKWAVEGVNFVFLSATPSRPGGGGMVKVLYAAANAREGKAVWDAL